MDETTKAALEAMEARLMGRINANHEQMLERFRAVDITLTAMNNTLGTMTALLNMLIVSLGDHAKRITDLEQKDKP